MSKLPFVCLNVEPESEDDEEIDNTAEIKLEEALKLYQQALKLHAQGPAAFADAQEAYEELFENEIFTYDEALSFRKRQEAIEGESTDSESDSDSTSERAFDQVPLPALSPAAVEGGPSTLRQVVYLSYKNYGQFQLDRLQHDLAEKGLAREPLDLLEPTFQKRVISRIRKSLESFSDALDKDDTDLELWRQVSRLAELLGSQRMTRYCLETVLMVNEEDDGVGAEDLIMAVAREDLSRVYSIIQDDVAGGGCEPQCRQKPVPSRIRQILDPFPSIPKPPIVASLACLPNREPKTLRLKVHSWMALGKQVLRLLKNGVSPDEDFSAMCVGFRIEDMAEANLKNDDSKSKRRRTIDSVENQRNGLITTDEMDINMGGIDGEFAPESIILPDGNTNSAQPESPTQEKSLPVRVMSTDEAQPSNDGPERPGASPVQHRPTTLKRSPDEAGLAPEPPEARSRSKRLRAREAGGDDDANKDLRQQIEKQLKPTQDADRHLFSVCETLLKRTGVTAMKGWDTLIKPAIGTESSTVSSSADDLAVALDDFKTSLKTWNSNRSSLLLHGTGAGATATLISKGNEAGLANFLEHAKSGQQVMRGNKPALQDQGLEAFIGSVNSLWLSLDELAVHWLFDLIGTQQLTETTSKDNDLPRYMSYTWPPELKTVVHEVLSHIDDFVFAKLDRAIFSWTELAEDMETEDFALGHLMEIIQTIFEIQLDVYDSMIKPTSKVDQPTRILQRARLQRWAFLSSQSLARNNAITDAAPSNVAIRHMFSMTLYLSLDEDSSRDHIILCLQEVKDKIEDGIYKSISIPNIDIMPEVSIEAVEQQLSRLTTTDFFMSVFNPSDDDPVATIESLEPIIMPLSIAPTDCSGSGSPAPLHNGVQIDGAASPSRQLLGRQQSPVISDSQTDQLLDFLSKSTASLRLSLWNRLTNAYAAIEAPAFVLLCTIHSMNIVLSELRTPIYTTQPEHTRMANLLIWVRNLMDLIDKCCALASSEPTALDCMDEGNLKLALHSIASCVKLFHLFALWDDQLRVGQATSPPQQGAANAFRQAMSSLRDMQVKTWRLLYVLIREASLQYPDLFPDASDEFLVYLAAVHSAIGLREYCRLGKKSFLKFVKMELLSLKPIDVKEWQYQMAQVAYDMYELRVLVDSNQWQTLQEHSCSPDQLDRATAREILPMVMAQIKGSNIRDIIKPDRRDFKQTIDKIQDLIGNPKASTVQQGFNRKQLLALQKKAIRGTDLMNALKGVGGLTNMPIKNDFSQIAKSGWFFVVGYLRLASFRSVKRIGPDSTKELTEAIDFLKFDIDFDCEKWETWYRLAQAYDSMLDEEVTWTADRINNKMEDLVVLQRQAIHCYSTAVALLVRLAEHEPEESRAQSQDTASTMSELFSDFGKRLYASSRAPFDMHAFSVKDHTRWFFTYSQVKFKDKPFRPMTEAAVWLVASVLFRQAISYREGDWHNWYMLGKCSWKLLNDEDVGGLRHEQVLYAFGKACELAPAKDSKQPDKGPLLEPHAKLVSVIHKLVYHRDVLTPAEGAEWLKKSSYSNKVVLEEPQEKQQWLDFARHVIRNLRTVDKANWHHRVMARAAQLAFEDPTHENPAEAAIMQYTPHIFTKTMVVQVWRTLFERAGRHFVYTTRYVNAFIDLLKMTGDRTGLEALGKRVRKKQAEFIDHLSIWTRICREHVSLLRSQEGVPDRNEERVLFVLPYETFVLNAALLQTWAQPANAEPPSHHLLTLLREAIDLKKLNLNLIPNQGIDDLIGDAYAKLYEDMVPGLVSNATNEKNREAMRVDRILMGDSSMNDRADSGAENAVSLTNPSGRAKMVGRMEVRRRAEALVQRLAVGPAPVKGKAAALAEAAAAQEEADESEANAAVSPDPNDDADDESELSELGDEQLEELQEGLDDLEDDANEEGDDGEDREGEGEAEGNGENGDEDGDDEEEVASDIDVDMDADADASGAGRALPEDALSMSNPATDQGGGVEISGADEDVLTDVEMA